MAMHSDDDYMVTEEASVGYQKRTLIDHVNLHVKKGEILTLIGPNGVGKSTILKSIIRQLSLIAGTVSVDGKELSAYAPRRLAAGTAHYDRSSVQHGNEEGTGEEDGNRDDRADSSGTIYLL